MRGLNSLRVYDASVTYAADVFRMLRAARVHDRDAEQLRRSVTSIGSNIAEGYGHGVGRNRLRYYRIARGSAQESLHQLRVIRNEGRISVKEFHDLFNRGRAIVLMLTGLVE